VQTVYDRPVQWQWRLWGPTLFGQWCTTLQSGIPVHWTNAFSLSSLPYFTQQVLLIYNFYLILISLHLSSIFNCQLQKCFSFWGLCPRPSRPTSDPTGGLLSPRLPDFAYACSFKNASWHLDRLLWLRSLDSYKVWYNCCIVICTNSTCLNWHLPLCQCCVHSVSKTQNGHNILSFVTSAEEDT